MSIEKGKVVVLIAMSHFAISNHHSSLLSTAQVAANRQGINGTPNPHCDGLKTGFVL
ncbi:MAG: hypothetical protein JNM43_11035 [Planctomycetaceae bacterium]|nr:hypothetical protein [Planctomycetaceae bacterium]